MKPLKDWTLEELQDKCNMFAGCDLCEFSIRGKGCRVMKTLAEANMPDDWNLDEPPDKNDFDYCLTQLSTNEILAQLAEEASELAQAALKLRRTTEPGAIPMTQFAVLNALDNLSEELFDVDFCALLYGRKVSGCEYTGPVNEEHEEIQARAKKVADRIRAEVNE